MHLPGAPGPDEPAALTSPSSSTEHVVGHTVRPIPLRVLVIEDSEDDTALLIRALRHDGYDPVYARVDTDAAMLAALADPDTAAARALATLGVDLDQAKDALRGIDVTGTSDEPPEEAGRRQMAIHVTGERLTVEATDPAMIGAGQAARRAPAAGAPDTTPPSVSE